jgi:hypothetical protein
MASLRARSAASAARPWPGRGAAAAMAAAAAAAASKRTADAAGRGAWPRPGAVRQPRFGGRGGEGSGERRTLSRARRTIQTRAEGGAAHLAGEARPLLEGVHVLRLPLEQVWGSRRVLGCGWRERHKAQHRECTSDTIDVLLPLNVLLELCKAWADISQEKTIRAPNCEMVRTTCSSFLNSRSIISFFLGSRIFSIVSASVGKLESTIWFSISSSSSNI